MPYNWFRAKPDAYGGAPVHLDLDPVGRSGRTLVTSGTTQLVLPSPYRKVYVRAVSAHCNSLAAGGTTVATLQKVVGGTGTPVSLTDGLTIEAMTAKVVSRFVMSSSATDADRLKGEADVLQVQFVNTGGISTQPVEFNVLAEVLQIE